MYRYRLHYAVPIAPGETIWTGDGRHLRVVDLIATEEDSDRYIGMLMVQSLSEGG